MEYFLKTHWNQPTAVEQRVVFAEQLLLGVASATQDLLTISNYEESIQTAMQDLGKATQVDRIYIFRHHLHPETFQALTSQSWEWVNHGVTPQIDNPELQNLPFNELFPRWYKEFLQGRSISGFVEMFPEQEREILDPQEILSIVVVPIHIQSVYWGFMGFDDCHYGHNWSNSEVAVLKSVANSFGGAFMRHQAGQDLIQKNTELKQQQIALQQAKVEAEQANATKSRFLAKIGHELRTPMNGILGYAQILERSTTLSHKEQRGVQVIHQCANHLLMLINDLLDLSKIEAEKLQLLTENVNLRRLVDEVLAVCQVRADAKGVRLISALDSSLPKIILTDAKRLKQVLLNLTYNAIKFTDQGQVTLYVSSLLTTRKLSDASESNGCRLRFAVEDTGIGIASDNLDVLFGAFEQISSRQDQSDGVGLGLSISQEIIQAMGSTIEVQSELEVGSIFFFDLDLSIVQPPRFSKQHGMIEANTEIKTDEENIPEESFDTHEKYDVQTEELADIRPPALSTLKSLKLLAQAGRLKKLIEVAQDIEANTPESKHFARSIIQLAQQFKTEEIEDYLGLFLEDSLT